MQHEALVAGNTLHIEMLPGATTQTTDGRLAIAQAVT
jgi:hypothetical protein